EQERQQRGSLLSRRALLDRTETVSTCRGAISHIDRIPREPCVHVIERLWWKTSEVRREAVIPRGVVARCNLLQGCLEFLESRFDTFGIFNIEIPFGIQLTQQSGAAWCSDVSLERLITLTL